MGNMHCKFPLTSILWLYIHRVHQVTMIYILHTVRDTENLTLSVAYPTGYLLTPEHWSMHRHADSMQTISRFRAGN